MAIAAQCWQSTVLPSRGTDTDTERPTSADPEGHLDEPLQGGIGSPMRSCIRFISTSGTYCRRVHLDGYIARRRLLAEEAAGEE